MSARTTEKGSGTTKNTSAERHNATRQARKAHQNALARAKSAGTTKAHPHEMNPFRQVRPVQEAKPINRVKAIIALGDLRDGATKLNPSSKAFDIIERALRLAANGEEGTLRKVIDEARRKTGVSDALETLVRGTYRQLMDSAFSKIINSDS